MRVPVRLLIVAASLAGVSGAPARAQAILGPPATIHDQATINVLQSQLQAREAMANRQAIGLQNQLSSLDSQLRTEQSLSDLRAQSYSPTIPQYAGAPPIVLDTSQLAKIPDDKLAASNARVRAVAEGRR